MNTHHMKQVIPVIDRLTGWGNPQQHPCTVTNERCGKVITFTLTKPEVTDMGFTLTFTRVGGHDNLWCMSTGHGEVTLINTEA